MIMSYISRGSLARSSNEVDRLGRIKALAMRLSHLSFLLSSLGHSPRLNGITKSLDST